MPTPLSPYSSQEIIPISPQSGSNSKPRRRPDPNSTVLPTPKTFVPKGELRNDVRDHIRAQERRVDVQNGKRRIKVEDGVAVRASPRKRIKKENGEMSRTQVTNRMVNPIPTRQRSISDSKARLTGADVDVGERRQSHNPLRSLFQVTTSLPSRLIPCVGPTTLSPPQRVIKCRTEGEGAQEQLHTGQ